MGAHVLAVRKSMNDELLARQMTAVPDLAIRV